MRRKYFLLFYTLAALMILLVGESTSQAQKMVTPDELNQSADHIHHSKNIVMKNAPPPQEKKLENLSISTGKIRGARAATTASPRVSSTTAAAPSSPTTTSSPAINEPNSETVFVVADSPQLTTPAPSVDEKTMQYSPKEEQIYSSHDESVNLSHENIKYSVSSSFNFSTGCHAFQNIETIKI
jgi:hypothetical protein